MKANHEMSNTRNASNRPTTADARVALKLVIRDIIAANPNSTLTEKRARVWLRANMRDAHSHNAAWDFDAAQYDRFRSHYDAPYAASIARAAKRNAKSPSTTTRKSRAKSATPANPEPVVAE